VFGKTGKKSKTIPDDLPVNGNKVDMSIAVEKSGIKLKIPPDDYVKSERSKSGLKKGEKKKKDSSSREPKPNLQKRISQRNQANNPKLPSSLHSIREMSAKEKNRRRIEELREAQHFEYVKRSGSLKQIEPNKTSRPPYQGIRRAASFGDPPKRRKRLKTRGERSRRAESGDRRSVSQPKSQDSGIVLEESSDQLETDHHRNKVNDEQPRFINTANGQKTRTTVLDSDENDIQARFRDKIDLHEAGGGKPIVAFNNSDPDITIRFREQFRRLDLNDMSSNEKSPAKDLARSDSDLLNIGVQTAFAGFDSCRPIDIEDKDIHISEEDHLDDAHKLNSKTEKNKIDPVARLNDWIDEVDQKQKDLSHRVRPPHQAKKNDPGWNSEADLCRPGSGLEQLSTFAERLTNQRKGKLIARHQSFAAIPSKPEVQDNSEHCESVGEGEGYLAKLPDHMPELSSSFRTKLAQWDDLGISRNQMGEHNRARKKRGSSSASAVLQRMSLPVVNWVGGGGTRSPEKTKKANNFIVEPREIKIDVTGHEQKPEPKVPALTIEQTHKRQSSCVSSHRGSSNNGAVSTLTKKSSDQKVEMNWELQQDVEQAEFRQQRKRRAKKCFPFSICA